MIFLQPFFVLRSCTFLGLTQSESSFRGVKYPSTGNSPVKSARWIFVYETSVSRMAVMGAIGATGVHEKSPPFDASLWPFAIQRQRPLSGPPIWRSESLSPHVSSSPEECFFHRHRYHWPRKGDCKRGNAQEVSSKSLASDLTDA